MQIEVVKKAYYGGRRINEGTVMDLPVEDEKDLPSWAVPVGTAVKKTPVRLPGKQPTTIHEMQGRKNSVQAKANVREREVGSHVAPQSRVVSTKGNTAKPAKAGKTAEAPAADDSILS
jgi:hypothetical protein